MMKYTLKDMWFTLIFIALIVMTTLMAFTEGRPTWNGNPVYFISSVIIYVILITLFIIPIAGIYKYARERNV